MLVLAGTYSIADFIAFSICRVVTIVVSPATSVRRRDVIIGKAPAVGQTLAGEARGGWLLLNGNLNRTDQGTLADMSVLIER